MRRFWGFPMGLRTLPVVTPKARVRRRSLGGEAVPPGQQEY
mgnify:CR=1 FL=1